MITVIAGITAKVVIGTILKTVGTGILFGASTYAGVKGSDKVVKTFKAKKAAKETVETENVEDTTESTKEEEVTENAEGEPTAAEA